MRVIALALIITGCAQGAAAPQLAKGSPESTEKGGTTGTRYAGRWKFAERCTSKGSPVACKEFLIINHIPAYMEFYDAGSKLRTLPLGGEPPMRLPVASFAEAKLDPKVVADSTKWNPRIVEADGRIREPTLAESYYHLGSDAQTPRYCFGDFCIHYASDGKTNDALDVDLAKKKEQTKSTMTKQGPVLFGMERRDTGVCNDLILADPQTIETVDWRGLCKEEDVSCVAVCPREKRLFGCETNDGANPYGIKNNIRVISWIYAGNDTLDRCPEETKRVKAD